MRIGLAFRAFWASLLDATAATAVERALEHPSAEAGEPKPNARLTPPTPPEKSQKPAGRSDALTLLATLQREARLIDLVQEPLSSYGDAQVGAAARQVLQDTQKVLKRLFDIEPIEAAEEGTVVRLPEQASRGAYSFTDGAAVSPGGSARIVHGGWRANRVQVPIWTGEPSEAMILTPAEVERS